MPIKIGNKNAFPYQGDYKPVNVYKGSTKLAGWRWATTSGIALARYQTDYKDTAQVSLEGNSIQPLSFREETGKSLTLTNHEELALRKLEVSGESAQVVTVQGKNLFNPTKVENLAWGGTNIILASGVYRGYSIPVKTGEVYSLSRSEATNNRLGIYFTETKPIANAPIMVTPYFRNDTWLKIEGVTVPTGANYMFLYLSNQGDVLPNIQLEKSATATTYAPFVPNSPSPDYPSPISNVEAVGVYSGIGGRNLVAINELNVNAINKLPNGIKLTEADWAISVLSKDWVKTKLKPSTTYRMKYDVKLIKKTATYSANSRIGQFFLYNNQSSPSVVMGRVPSATYQSMNVGDVVSVDSTFTTPTDITNHIVLAYTVNVYDDVAVMEFTNIKLELGTTATPWTPAPEDIPLNTTTNNTYITKPTLTAPLKKVGDVADRLFYDKTVNKWKVERRVAVTGLDDGTQTIAQAYSPLATPVIETLPDGTLPPLFKPTTYLDTTSTLKGDIKAGYQLATTATPLETDIKVAPEYVNPIQSVDAVDVVSSAGGRNYWVNSLMLDAGNYERIVPYYYYTVSGLKPNTEYTMSINPDIDLDSIPKPSVGNKALRINNKKENPTINVLNVLSDRVETFKRTVTSTEDGVLYILNYNVLRNEIGELFPKGIILKEASDTQDWTPAPEDILPDTHTPTLYHTQPTLSAPLRKVGDVKDRLFRDADGLWKVERNVAITGLDDGTKLISEVYSQAQPPTIETLPQADQDKLNAIPTYRGDNYVYTVSNVEPSGLSVAYKVRDI